MSAEILEAPLNRGVAAYKKLQAAHAAAIAVILEQDAKIATDTTLLAKYKALMDETWPEDTGGSTGGVVG